MTDPRALLDEMLAEIDINAKERRALQDLAASWNAPMLAAEREMHLQHHDGHTWWDEAPLPRRWHRCTVWTTAVVNFRRVDRCACGAVRTDGRHWDERNARRKETT